MKVQASEVLAFATPASRVPANRLLACTVMARAVLTRAVLTRVLLTSALLTGQAVIGSAQAAPHESAYSDLALDRQLAATLESLTDGNLAQARVLARQLARQFPRFALGQLLSAELEAAASFQDVRAAGVMPMSQKLIDLLLEAQARTSAAVMTPEHVRLPRGVIQIGKHLNHLLVIDLSRSTLYQLASNSNYSTVESTPRLIRQHYVSSGKAGFGKRLEGDNKTPLGIYRINGHRSSDSLPELYGSGALMLDYPNALDQHLGRTGSGIWLHGVPHTQRSRAPRSSEGCVTMSNDHLTALVRSLSHSETVVMLTDEVSWIDRQQNRRRQQSLRDAFLRFQQAHISGDKNLLHALYETPETLLPDVDEPVDAMGLASLKPADISIFLVPGTTGLAVTMARFGAENEQQLTIYWSKGDDDQWQVVTDQWDGRST